MLKENQSRTSHTFLKIFIGLVVVLLIILVSGLVSLFASNGEQSYASAMFDFMGWHQLAFAIDAFRKNPDFMSQFATLNPGASCQNG